MSKLCLAALTAMITASVTAQAQQPVKPAQAQVFPQRTNIRAEALKDFDKDGDGKLSDEERKVMRETLIKRHQGKGKDK